MSRLPRWESGAVALGRFPPKNGMMDSIDFLFGVELKEAMALDRLHHLPSCHTDKNRYYT